MPKLITTQTRIADLGKPRVIIIGGGFGGLEVAKGLLESKAQIVLFDKYNHHTFQPLLYQVATSALETSSIVFPFRKRFARAKDFYFRLGEVTKIVPESNCIETSIGCVQMNLDAHAFQVFKCFFSGNIRHAIEKTGCRFHQVDIHLGNIEFGIVSGKDVLFKFRNCAGKFYPRGTATNDNIIHVAVHQLLIVDQKGDLEIFDDDVTKLDGVDNRFHRVRMLLNIRKPVEIGLRPRSDDEKIIFHAAN